MKTSKGARRARARGARSGVGSGLIEPPEEGLSVDPDELGTSFLRYATDQGNFETVRATSLEFAPPVEPASDDAPREPAGPGTNLWDRTIDQVLSSQEPRDRDPSVEPAEAPEREPTEPTRGVAQIDLNASVIEEATLLDAEGEELGELVRDPASQDSGGPPKPAQRAHTTE